MEVQISNPFAIFRSDFGSHETVIRLDKIESWTARNYLVDDLSTWRTKITFRFESGSEEIIEIDLETYISFISELPD